MEINDYLIQFFEIVQELETVKLFPEMSKFTPTEFRILREVILEEKKGKHIISSELARRVGVTRSAVSQIVTKLEQKGIVKREDAPDDRKIAYIVVSDGISSLFDKEYETVNATMERIVETFGREKMDAMMGLCREFVSIVKNFKEEMSNGEIRK